MRGACSTCSSANSSKAHHPTFWNLDFPLMAELYFNSLWLLKYNLHSNKCILDSYTPNSTIIFPFFPLISLEKLGDFI